jgi:hypothetical protein
MEGIFPKLLAVRDWVERGHVNGLETHKLAHAWCRRKSRRKIRLSR